MIISFWWISGSSASKCWKNKHHTHIASTYEIFLWVCMPMRVCVCVNAVKKNDDGIRFLDDLNFLKIFLLFFLVVLCVVKIYRMLYFICCIYCNDLGSSSLNMLNSSHLSRFAHPHVLPRKKATAWQQQQQQ